LRFTRWRDRQPVDVRDSPLKVWSADAVSSETDAVPSEPLRLLWRCSRSRSYWGTRARRRSLDRRGPWL